MYSELHNVDILVINSGRLLKMPVRDRINAAALDCTLNSIPFSFAVGDGRKSARG